MKKLSSLDILNDTAFAMGANINMIEVEEEGSVELDESEELFLDDNESIVNLGGIVGSTQRNIIMEA